MKKLKIVDEVPTPPEITEEILKEIGKEAEAWRKAYDNMTKGMVVVRR